MYHIVNTKKSFKQASADLETEVVALGFGVLHIHDLGETLRGKGFDFAEECQVFEVCNPQQAFKVLSIDMKLNMALPCRISVYTQQGETKIGMIEPVQMLSALSDDSDLLKIANEVEETIIQIMNNAI